MILTLCVALLVGGLIVLVGHAGVDAYGIHCRRRETWAKIHADRQRSERALRAFQQRATN